MMKKFPSGVFKKSIANALYKVDGNAASLKNNKPLSIERNDILIFLDPDQENTYELDFANYAIPEEFFSMDVMNGYNLINKNGFGMITRYFENDHYSVFEIMLQKQNSPASIRQVVYSKKKDSFFSHEFRADSESKVLLKHLISLTSNNELVYLVFPYALKTCNDKILDEIFPDKEYEKISDTANPLIIKCKISRK